MTFLRTFYGYSRSRTDAPPEYALLAGMGALSTALGSRVCCDGRGRDIYPNIWGVNIGPSGMGKSVALDLSRRVVEKAGLGGNISSESFSIEALFDALKKEPTRIFFLQEFSAFMRMLHRDYNDGAEQALTEFYDVPLVWKRDLRPGPRGEERSIVLEKPCLTIVGATAPEWFGEAFRLSSLRSGFLVRFMYCPRDKRGAYVADPGPFNEAIEAELAGHLRQIAERCHGRADFSKVRGAWNAWEEKNRQGLDGCPPDFVGMRTRLPVLVRKCTMLTHVSRDPSNVLIEMEDLQQAITYVERTQAEAEVYLRTKIAHDKDDADVLRVLEILERHGGQVPRSKVLMDSHLGAFRLDRAVKTLEQSERVREGQVDTTKKRWLTIVQSPNGVSS